MSNIKNYWLVFVLCGLATANHFILHGGHFSTEEGKLFSASFVDSKNVEKTTVRGCKVECANSCLNSSKGSALVNCYNSCGCGFLITEIQQKLRDEIIAAYYRDLSIEISPKFDEGEKSLDIEITGPADPVTGKYPKPTEISYETEGTEEELEIKAPHANDKDYSEFEFNHNYTQSQNVQDDFYEWTESSNAWNGQANERTEYGEEYVESNFEYQIPAQGIAGEAVRNFTMHTDSTGQVIGKFSSDYNSTTKTGTTEDVFDIEYTFSSYNTTHSSYNQTDSSYNQTDSSYNQTDSSYNQTDSSYNQTDSSYNQTDSSYNQTDSSYNQTDSSYNQTDFSSSQSDVLNNQPDIPTNQTDSSSSQSELFNNQADSSQIKTTPDQPKVNNWDNGYDYDIKISWSSLSRTSTNLVSLPAEESLFAYIASLLLKILFLALFILGVALLSRKHILNKHQENSDELPESYYTRL